MSQNSTAVLSSAHITNLEVANNIRINNETQLNGPLKTGTNNTSGTVGQHLISRGPNISPEWATTTPDYKIYDICIIGAGEAGITALTHAINLCSNNEKIVLITDGPQKDDFENLKSWISFPQNLPPGDLKDEMLKIIQDNSNIGIAQGGYNSFNIGGDSYRNKLDNIYAYRFSNNSDPDNPNNSKGGFDFGSWQVKQVGGYNNINGGNSGTDPLEYRVFKADETWNGVSTGLLEDNLDNELDIYLKYFPNLRQRPVRLLPGESYPNTKDSVNNYIRLSENIEDALQNSSSGIKDTSYTIENDNFFTSGRKNWTSYISLLQQNNPNVEIVYNTEVNSILNVDKNVKTIMANNKQFKLLTKKIIIAGGQLGTTRLMNQISNDNLKLFNNIKPKFNFQENCGNVVLSFLTNIKPDNVPGSDVNYRSLVVGRELYDKTKLSRHQSTTIELQMIQIININYDPHFLRLVGILSDISFDSTEYIFTNAPYVEDLQILIHNIQFALLGNGQRFLDVDKIKDPNYESELGLTQDERDKLYARWSAYTWDKNKAIPAEIAKARAAGKDELVVQLELLFGVLSSPSVKVRCIPYGWLSITGFIIYQPSVLTALLGNSGNIIEHDSTLEREFKLDRNSTWVNERSEDSNAREFRLIQSLIGTHVKTRMYDFENTKLSPELLTQFKKEFVSTSKEVYSRVLYGPKSVKFNILKNISLGYYNILGPEEYFGPLGFIPWVADDSEGFNNVNNAVTNTWYATEEDIDITVSDDEWIKQLQKNIQVVWHATQHFKGLIDPKTNKVKNLNNIWIGDQTAWTNITPSSSSTLSAMMGIRAVNDVCKSD